jgi:hypothetical protein
MNTHKRCLYELLETGPSKFRKQWLGPRGKQLTGTGKRLARLLWDRARFGNGLAP